MKSMKTFLFFLLLALFVTGAHATAQMPDKIVYKGETHYLHSNPLEVYFEKNPEKRPKSGIMSTALWRGYVATFEFSDDFLVVKNIEIEVRKKDTENFETEWISVLTDVVPGGQTLKVDWLTGILVIPQGKIVNYIHMGYASTYERYTLIEVEKGNFKKALEMDHKKYASFKERQFAAFKETDEYKKLFEDMKKDRDNSDEFIENFLRIFVISYSSKILVD